MKEIHLLIKSDKKLLKNNVKIGVTAGCSGNKAYTKIADEEMIMGIPIEPLANVVADLKEICPK